MLDPSDDPYQNLLKIRAYEGWPGTYILLQKSNKELRIKILDAEIRDGKLELLRVIPEGKREMMFEEFLATRS